jgi:hypothetical protein
MVSHYAPATEALLPENSWKRRGIRVFQAFLRMLGLSKSG